MTTYAMHYAAKAPADSTANYDPRISPYYLRPACKIRGRKDVTSDWDRVTCSACLKRKPAAPVEEEAMSDNTPPIRLAYVSGALPAAPDRWSEQLRREDITIAEAVADARWAHSQGFVNITVTAYDKGDEMIGDTFESVDWRNWTPEDAPVEAESTPEGLPTMSEDDYRATAEYSLQSAAHYVSGAVSYLGAHPYAALCYLRSAQELLSQAEARLIAEAAR